MSEMMVMMQSFIKSSDERAKLQDSQYDAQQIINIKTEKRMDELTVAVQTLISTNEENQKNVPVIDPVMKKGGYDSSRYMHSGDNLTGILLACVLEQSEKHTNALQEEIKRLQKNKLYEAIKKIK